MQNICLKGRILILSTLICCHGDSTETFWWELSGYRVRYTSFNNTTML